MTIWSFFLYLFHSLDRGHRPSQLFARFDSWCSVKAHHHHHHFAQFDLQIHHDSPIRSFTRSRSRCSTNGRKNQYAESTWVQAEANYRQLYGKTQSSSPEHFEIMQRGLFASPPAERFRMQILFSVFFSTSPSLLFCSTIAVNNFVVSLLHVTRKTSYDCQPCRAGVHTVHFIVCTRFFSRSGHVTKKKESLRIS